MIFRTEIQPNPSHVKITHKSGMLFIGSCFTENIGVKLKELAFPVLINPTGIVYNPLSVKRSLEILVEGKEYTENDVFHFNDLYYSFDHDTSFSHPELNECLKVINTNLIEGQEQLAKASLILITFGTAWVYLHKKSQNLVSNCHKIPSSEFNRKLLSVEEIVSEYLILINNMQKINPGIKFIFTVSPVRHWKDGAVGNQISKSSLVLAVHKLIEKLKGTAEYFPAYELLLDDLRDYRFYANDLLHPSDEAIAYIWEKFSGVYFDHQTTELIKEIAALASAAKHKPFNKETPAWNNFLEKNLQKVMDLNKKYPFLDLSSYEKYFRDGIQDHE